MKKRIRGRYRELLLFYRYSCRYCNALLPLGLCLFAPCVAALLRGTLPLMLSYQHAYHAGNHADILKHLTLSLVARYFALKDKPFTYLDSHAGAGLYLIDSEESRTTGEAAAGILSLMDRSDAPEPLGPYLSLCRALRERGLMPGSGEVVRSFARDTDRLMLMEKHPQEIRALEANMGCHRNVAVHYRDGWDALVSLTPPAIRRGFCLVDPSYEEVAEYPRAADTLNVVRRRWNVGTLCLWYPLVGRRSSHIAAMKTALGLDPAAVGGPANTSPGKDGQDPDILCAELCVRPPAGGPSPGGPTAGAPPAGGLPGDAPSQGFGLYGSGMIVVRPPWKLAGELFTCLSWLASALEQAPGAGSWSIRGAS